MPIRQLAGTTRGSQHDTLNCNTCISVSHFRRLRSITVLKCTLASVSIRNTNKVVIKSCQRLQWCYGVIRMSQTVNTLKTDTLKLALTYTQRTDQLYLRRVYHLTERWPNRKLIVISGQTRQIHHITFPA